MLNEPPHKTSKKVSYQRAINILKKSNIGVTPNTTVNEFSDAVHKNILDALKQSEVEIKGNTSYKKLSPWTTKELAELTCIKSNMYKNMRANPGNTIIVSNYKKINNQVNELRSHLKAGEESQRLPGTRKISMEGA